MVAATAPPAPGRRRLRILAPEQHSSGGVPPLQRWEQSSIRVLQELFELVDRARPERLVAPDPLACLLERRGAQAEAVDAPLDAALDQACALQHLEMPRDRGLCRAEMRAEL